VTVLETRGVHQAKACGYELTVRREGETAVVTIRHSPLSPAGLRATFVLGLLVLMCWLITGFVIVTAARGSPGAAFSIAAVVALGLAILAVQVPKQLMVMFGSQSVHATGDRLTVRQDCVVWSRVEVLELPAGYVVPADRGWFRRYWEESLWARPGVIGGLSVHAANDVEIARFGVGISRRTAERLCGGGRVELFDSQLLSGTVVTS